MSNQKERWDEYQAQLTRYETLCKEYYEIEERLFGKMAKAERVALNKRRKVLEFEMQVVGDRVSRALKALGPYSGNEYGPPAY